MNTARQRANVSKENIQRFLLRTAFSNLVIVALLGLVLRVAAVLPNLPFVYKNLLHGHSHFAFGGWVLPVLLALVMKAFPEIKASVAKKHWRNVGGLALVSAYGMLIFFPMYGYRGISIFFSTLSVAAIAYFAVVVWNATRRIESTIAHRFLRWGLLYAVVSALGPFATVPLIVAGKQGTPLYFDLVYFYLHFQYNGFFTFAVLALWYKKMPGKGSSVFHLMNLACPPAYALSVLWHQPAFVFNVIGAVAAVLQLAAVCLLWRDAKQRKWSALFWISFFLFALKMLLQAAGALPGVALMACEVRDFVIAYLHLALLGFVSTAVFDAVAKRADRRLFKPGVQLFLFSFFSTESLLLWRAMRAARLLSFNFPFSSQLLVALSLPFALGAFLMALSTFKKHRSRSVYKSFLLNERSASQSGTTIQSNMTASV